MEDSQAPISKHQIPNNIQAPISNQLNSPSSSPFPLWGVGEFGLLEFVIYLEFGDWNLGFTSFQEVQNFPEAPDFQIAKARQK
jgi:hypothetical protein